MPEDLLVRRASHSISRIEIANPKDLEAVADRWDMAGLTYTTAMPRASQHLFPMWRAAWAGLSTALRAFWLLVVGMSVFGTVLMGIQIGGEDFLFRVTNWTSVVAPVGAGALLAFAALRQRSPGTAAWSLIGVGVALWGLGELVWVYCSWLLEVDVPDPGVADVFYVAAYPMIFVGILLLPHMQVRKWERVRLPLDALAGTMALYAVVWTFYLKDAIYLDRTDRMEMISIVNSLTKHLARIVGDLVEVARNKLEATKLSYLTNGADECRRQRAHAYASRQIGVGARLV